MEIKEYREINKGCLKAAFILEVAEWGGLQIACTYFEKDNGNAWVNLAPKEYVDREGNKKTSNLVRFRQGILDALNSAVKEKIRNKDFQVKETKQEEAEKVNKKFEETDEVPF